MTRHGIEEYTAIIVMSDKSEQIRTSIIDVLQRGVTVFKGRGGRSNEDQDILYCVVTRLEIGRVKGVVDGLDDDAFIVIYPLADVHGGVFRRSAVHELKA